MYRISTLVVLTIGMAAAAFAHVSSVPEIDPGSATTALALVSGVLLIIRGRRRKAL